MTPTPLWILLTGTACGTAGYFCAVIAAVLIGSPAVLFGATVAALFIVHPLWSRVVDRIAANMRASRAADNVP